MTDGPQYQVSHRTRFDYAIPANHSTNLLHLEPRTFPFQRTVRAFIRVIPATRLQRFEDLFGNVTHQFEISRPHQTLEIASVIRVQNLVLEVPSASREATIDDLEDADIRQTTWPFLQESRYVSRHPEIWRQALDLTSEVPSVFEKSHRIMDWIYTEFSYVAGATGVSTHLEEAFQIRRGVCQDFTHVMLGLCRAIGIPARYASGYLYNGPTDDLVGAQASHAWPEVFLPGLGWVGFDPTNGNLADERYIKVAVGKDYEDVAPIRGTYSGTGQCEMTVTVEVEKIER
ncbi:transglutaminase family protein [Haloferula rosea]|uniref:Transglutaminase family protein n=1 Tax=Haloferula rosea TaxID=490093 RepID=A0A934VD53_9BACT|nr:transglutaminase family protein [Haloferula rosea]MBK1825934.1 transglutaminase family protein [Haloferula rosea]